MNRITRTAVVLMSGLALANGARADFFLFKKTPPATSSTPDQAQTLPAYQTQPPPLAADMPVQGSAPMPISSVAPVSAQAPATAPRTVPPATLQNNVVSGVTENVVVGSQALRVSRVNSKLVQVGYDIKDYGPSGIAGVEVWYTRDGQTWQKFDGIQRENPAWVELEEGTYGLTLVAKTGFGGGKEPPVAGDQPQLWVEVDLTKPVVFLNGVNLTNGTRTLNITWTARDDHFGRQPINLYYAERMPARGCLSPSVWRIPVDSCGKSRPASRALSWYASMRVTWQATSAATPRLRRCRSTWLSPRRTSSDSPRLAASRRERGQRRFARN